MIAVLVSTIVIVALAAAIYFTLTGDDF